MPLPTGWRAYEAAAQEIEARGLPLAHELGKILGEIDGLSHLGLLRL